MSSLKRLLVVDINFWKTLNINERKFVHSEFSKLGKLIHWTDYLTKAGYMHHAGHSRAVYQIEADPTSPGDYKIPKKALSDKLQRIIGITTLSDFQSLQNGKIQQIKPTFKFDSNRKNNQKLLKEARVNFADLEDPFFTVTSGLDLRTRSLIRVSASCSIPMKVQTSDVVENSN